MAAANRVPEVIATAEDQILNQWVQELKGSGFRTDLISAHELEQQCREFLSLLKAAWSSGTEDITAGPWRPVMEFLAGISRSRARAGFTPSQTATFVFALKRALFTALRGMLSSKAEAAVEEVWTVNLLIDKLGLYTTEVFQKSREEIIQRQHRELTELSTPVVNLWRGVLALPLIGTLDSERTQVVMESLLQRIVESGSQIAIIDITGVPTVDTLVAQHLMKTVAAARLMGADCIISGIRPQIAQTIVHLGISLSDVVTKASLAAALKVALERLGYSVVRGANGASESSQSQSE